MLGIEHRKRGLVNAALLANIAGLRYIARLVNVTSESKANLNSRMSELVRERQWLL